ncbi:aliphatic sulfonate ABC transporter substrate-binding protein [Haematobacter massiliensis]|uniref:Putative aliphatic sulfonates-binding protein n=1 Tax=Haematobacter massiliensis TaxID=195105 RepID=A0A086Y269_9RHOB|nr:ABC transporter substrate-binding protein [Haematobacter massiliensis]KFI28369.1 aliphatic sulfonate ABC transporter substrate-binding protein [Haematobacter massiliensis]OWJ84692.1 aliphatic sulfonate ABC transporter substrate-binding protein [Haematobacter massiliensis]QBJ26343.1 ABC transporter substrate-binding protein [Haematobacter massiliensis]
MTITRRAFGAIAALALLAAPLAAQDLKGVTLRVADQVGESRARLQAAGLLDDVPYTIEWSVYPAAVNLHEALKAGAADVGMSADSPAVAAIAGGSKIRIAGVFNNGGLGSAIIVPKDSGIRTLADLKGKTISPTTRGSVAHYLVLGALKQAGIDPSEVKLAFLTPSDAAAAFQSGGIDAWGTWGVYKARSTGVLGAQTLFDGKGVNTGNAVYAVTDEALADPAKRAAISDYLARIERSYDWARSDREAFLTFYQQFSKQDRATVEPLYEEQTAYVRKPVDDALAAQLQQVFATWVEAGVLKGDLDLSAYVYHDLLVETTN